MARFAEKTGQLGKNLEAKCPLPNTNPEKKRVFGGGRKSMRCKDVLGRMGNILLAESTFHLLSNNLVGHGLKAGNTNKSLKNPL